MDEESSMATPDAKVIGDFIVYIKKSLGNLKMNNFKVGEILVKYLKLCRNQRIR